MIKESITDMLRKEIKWSYTKFSIKTHKKSRESMKNKNKEQREQTENNIKHGK